MTKPHNLSTKFIHLFIGLLGMFFLILLDSCATFKEHQEIPLASKNPSQEISYTFFLAGGYGNAVDNSNKKLLERFISEINKSGKNSTVIFTGDNISTKTDSWTKDSTFVTEQMDLVKEFKGNTIFLPGNNEWKSYDLDKMEKVEDYLKDIDKDGIEVFPENGCPLEYKVINEDLDLILIDSKWFISN
ncbi:metallophosphoesterase [Maribacter litopenaei]|uniref:Metallophosphoesterase n=1 Tax=Maribacter litopenaei TaxID=2976127 RepID=A0ABY5Y6E3_9FLAO|nr:metallophosphoesterase [Maribacter litopenaei]UWX54423.1 metallophosphoesterase [Maribacter litopenaei]